MRFERYRRQAAGRALRLPVLALLMLAGCSEPPAPGQIVAATDLAGDRKIAQRLEVPLLLVVTQHDCPYCKRLKKEVFRPMLLSGDYEDKVIIRELLIEPQYPLAGFRGEQIGSLELASGYAATFVPTVLVLDGQGEEVADRLLGINTAEMYGYYLDRAIEEATERIRRAGAAETG